MTHTIKLNEQELATLETDLAQHIYEFLARRTRDVEELDAAFEAFKDFEYCAERRANTAIRQYVEIYNAYAQDTVA